MEGEEEHGSDHDRRHGPERQVEPWISLLVGAVGVDDVLREVGVRVLVALLARLQPVALAYAGLGAVGFGDVVVPVTVVTGGDVLTAQCHGLPVEGVAIALQLFLVAFAAHSIRVQPEFGGRGREDRVGSVAGVADRAADVVGFEDLGVDAGVEDVLHQDMALAAGAGNAAPADPGIRVGVGKDVVDAVAVVAARRHHQAVDQQGPSVDGVDEVGYGALLVDGVCFEHELALVADGAGLVEVELVGPGSAIGGREDVVSAVTIRTGCGLLIALGVLTDRECSAVYSATWSS